MINARCVRKKNIQATLGGVKWKYCSEVYGKILCQSYCPSTKTSLDNKIVSETIAVYEQE